MTRDEKLVLAFAVFVFMVALAILASGCGPAYEDDPASSCTNAAGQHPECGSQVAVTCDGRATPPADLCSADGELWCCALNWAQPRVGQPVTPVRQP